MLCFIGRLMERNAHMTAILRTFRPTIDHYKNLHGEFFSKLRAQRYPDGWWDMEDSWEGLDDIVEDYGIDISSCPCPMDYKWDSRDTYISAFLDPRLGSFFEAVNERVLPDAVHGEMYIGEGGSMKSAREITWSERMDALAGKCRCCRGFDYQIDGDWGDLLVLEEGDEIARVWTFGEIGTCAFGIADDYGRVTDWDGSQPLRPVGCDGFEWS